MNQTDSHNGKNYYFLPSLEPGILAGVVLISHPPHIVDEQGHMLPSQWPDWHGRQTVYWGGAPAHAHLAHQQGVELTHILCFSEKKGRFSRWAILLRLPLCFKRERAKCF